MPMMLPGVGDQSPVPGSDQETLVTLTSDHWPRREDTGGRKVHVSRVHPPATLDSLTLTDILRSQSQSHSPAAETETSDGRPTLVRSPAWRSNRARWNEEGTFLKVD